MQSMLSDICCVSGTVLDTRETMVSKTDEVALWKLLSQMVRQVDRENTLNCNTYSTGGHP